MPRLHGGSAFCLQVVDFLLQLVDAVTEVLLVVVHVLVLLDLLPPGLLIASQRVEFLGYLVEVAADVIDFVLNH